MASVNAVAAKVPASIFRITGPRMVKLTDKSLDMGDSAKFNRRFRMPARAGVRRALGCTP